MTEKNQNGWYSAVLLYRSQITDSREDGLWECSVRLFRGCTEEEVRNLAEEEGRRSEHSYENPDGQTVSWLFKKVLRIEELNETTIHPGIEVFSWMDNAEAEPDGWPRI